MNDILKMNDRPTPDTDAFSVKFKSVCGSKAWVPTDICRRFERERGEAREVLRMISVADWKTAGELRGMARRALEAAK
jgi:hypothetical protein